jgi:tetratricopeptide (TPR) repeat protein
MRSRNWPGLIFIFLYILPLAAYVIAQASPDTADAAKRQKALALFDQGKRLEALPLLEALVKANPRDDELLVALAACLVDHAATLTDQEAAGKERLRASQLLDQAWKLGNTSSLAMNLSQLLKQLPASGAIKFSANPEADQFMRVGEAAFARRDYDEAIRDYEKALELEPTNYSAALFIGNAYDKKNDFAKGAESYQRAIQLDPNVETAYRYYADMLAREGDMGKARAMLIQAAVAEPYNRIVWRELHAWATLNHTEINRVLIGVPPPPKDVPGAKQPPTELSPVWRAYYTTRASWQKGGEFQKRFPAEKEYRHSSPEESEALTAAAKVADKLATDKKTAELVANDTALALLLNLQQAGLIESYVLFSLGDAGIARDYAPYRAKNREKLQEYMDKFVVPPAK